MDSWREIQTVVTPGGETLELVALRTISEMQQLVELQRDIWGYGGPDADPPYPARALFALSQSGGLIACARLAGRIVGFSVAWLGRMDDPPAFYLHSQLVGLVSEFRHLNIGYQLKLFQRAYALSLGLQLMRWTFDPMRSANANLNLRKLGAVVERFTGGFYGTLQSRFSSGGESDRVWAEWHLNSRRVRRRLEGSRPGDRLQDLPRFNRVEEGRPVSVVSDLQAPVLLLEIPAGFEDLRNQQPELAGCWRRHVGGAFQELLSRGYRACELMVDSDAEGRPTFYLFRRAPLADLLVGE